jgi:hypothetical protein
VGAAASVRELRLLFVNLDELTNVPEEISQLLEVFVI